MLFFNFGTMNAGKSELLIREYKRLKNEGENILVWNSELDERHKGYVSSRNPELDDIQSSLYKNTTNLFNKFFIEIARHGWTIHNSKRAGEPGTTLLVDEAQFLTAQQVDQLSMLAEYKDVTVECYGLRTDYEGNLFEGAKRLFEVADDTLCLETACEKCASRPAIFNARFYHGELYNGEKTQIMIDNNEAVKYIPLCRTCFNLVKEKYNENNNN